MQRYTLFNKPRNFSDIFFSKIKFYHYFYKIIRKRCTVSNKTILEIECYIYYIMYVYNICMVHGNMVHKRKNSLRHYADELKRYVNKPRNTAI